MLPHTNPRTGVHTYTTRALSLFLFVCSCLRRIFVRGRRGGAAAGQRLQGTGV